MKFLRPGSSPLRSELDAHLWGEPAVGAVAQRYRAVIGRAIVEAHRAFKEFLPPRRLGVGLGRRGSSVCAFMGGFLGMRFGCAGYCRIAVGEGRIALRESGR